MVSPTRSATCDWRGFAAAAAAADAPVSILGLWGMDARKIEDGERQCQMQDQNKKRETKQNPRDSVFKIVFVTARAGWMGRMGQSAIRRRGKRNLVDEDTILAKGMNDLAMFPHFHKDSEFVFDTRLDTIES